MLPEKRSGRAEDEAASAIGDEGPSAVKKAKGGDDSYSLIPPLASSSSDNSRPANGMEIDPPANGGGRGGGGGPPEIDEDLHSRQLAVYGRETMRRLFASNVLVSGMDGLGVEIAKNLVLAGVKSVTLHDEGSIELWDLSSNFYFSEADVGKNRAFACVQKLQELNSAVLVSTLTETLSKEQFSDFQAVVFTDILWQKAIEFDDYYCNHQPPIAFIRSEVRGLFGTVFCDFGPEFTVVDVDGEEPHTGWGTCCIL